MSKENLEKTMQLASCSGLGPRLYLRLIKHFGTISKIFSASRQELLEVKDIGTKLASSIQRASEYDPEPELKLAAQNKVEILTQDNPAYPAPLKSTFDPPILLYLKGKLKPTDALALAIVGTRQPSHYGRSQAERFANLLTRAGFTIVSGLARGIDSAAHRGCLNAGGRTLAVLGTGIDYIYPAENRDIAAEISENGAILSEFPFGTKPAKENFPRRNRIVAGLSLGTLVIEAPQRSGALITARLANEMGREIFCLPGRADYPGAKGSNKLISTGQAKLVQDLEDILEELGEVAAELQHDKTITAKKADNKTNEIAIPVNDSNEEKILGTLALEPVHIDQICARSNLPAQEVSASLMILELKRKVKQQPGNFFIKA